MSTATTDYAFDKPTIGGDSSSWGTLLNGNWDALDNLLSGDSPISGIDIDSGSIDGAPIGANSASTGSFTTLSLTGNLTTSGLIDGVDVAALKTDFDALDASVTGTNTGDEATATESVEGVVELATAAEILSAAASNVMTGQRYYDAKDEVTLTDSATIAVDLDSGINFDVTITANRTLGNPSNTKVGQTGVIRVVQDGTGGHTLALAGNYEVTPGSHGGIDELADAETMIHYFVVSSTRILVWYEQVAGAAAMAARATVQFNGTGTLAVNYSENVSSVSDDGTGLYTVNFDVDAPDTDYVAVWGGIYGTDEFGASHGEDYTNRAVGSIQVKTRRPNDAQTFDADSVNGLFFWS